jgi:hypothetical protein
MQPKIAYLVDENFGWDDEQPSRKFYTEEDVPEHHFFAAGNGDGRVKRIVYWEIEETE